MNITDMIKEAIATSNRNGWEFAGFSAIGNDSAIVTCKRDNPYRPEQGFSTHLFFIQSNGQGAFVSGCYDLTEGKAAIQQDERAIENRRYN